MGGVGARNWRRSPRRGARNRTGVYGTLPYAAGGIVLWLLLHEAGLHATLMSAITLGLVAGKPVGIVLAASLAGWTGHRDQTGSVLVASIGRRSPRGIRALCSRKTSRAQHQMQTQATLRSTATARRVAAGEMVAIPLTTVSVQGNFDAWIDVQFPAPGRIVTASLLVDSGSTTMIIPNGEDLVGVPGYKILGTATEPWPATRPSVIAEISRPWPSNTPSDQATPAFASAKIGSTT